MWLPHGRLPPRGPQPLAPIPPPFPHPVPSPVRDAPLAYVPGGKRASDFRRSATQCRARSPKYQTKGRRKVSSRIRALRPPTPRAIVATLTPSPPPYPYMLSRHHCSAGIIVPQSSVGGTHSGPFSELSTQYSQWEAAMAAKTQIWCVFLMCLAAVAAGRMIGQEGGSACNLPLKTVTYLSAPLTAMPGEANNKFYLGMFPKGHIGIKSLNADLVDQNGVSIPLTDLYLHHWVMLEYRVPKDKAQKHLGHILRKMKRHPHNHLHYDTTKIASFEAPHHHHMLGDDKRARVVNFFGKGGETRHTQTELPGYYVVESGKEFEGYESAWVLNVHALDTRGAVNSEGCSECRCHLYNATHDEDGKPLPEGYIGGLRCCGDGFQCAVKPDYNGGVRKFYLRYTFEYYDWSECLIPTASIGIDITNHKGFDENLIEFTVDGCGDSDPNSEECLDTREAYLVAPIGGEVVFSVSHLHASTLDAAIYGEDGRLICRTTPMYGTGYEAGNEKGHVVGIKSCYGNPGTPNAGRVRQGEELKYVVQSTKVNGPHTGLMGLAGIRIVADGEKAVM